jgi:hypothetical protein
MNNCKEIYSSYAHGSKGSAIISSGGDCGLPSKLFKTQGQAAGDLLWESNVPGPEQDPYLNEWNDLIDAIRNDKPYPETERGVFASAVSSLGRAAAHTGLEITLEEFMNSSREYAPDLDKLTMDSPAPLRSDASGRYPIPEPGMKHDAEY